MTPDMPVMVQSVDPRMGIRGWQKARLSLDVLSGDVTIRFKRRKMPPVTLALADVTSLSIDMCPNPRDRAYHVGLVTPLLFVSALLIERQGLDDTGFELAADLLFPVLGFGLAWAFSRLVKVPTVRLDLKDKFGTDISSPDFQGPLENALAARVERIAKAAGRVVPGDDLRKAIDALGEDAPPGLDDVLKRLDNVVEKLDPGMIRLAGGGMLGSVGQTRYLYQQIEQTLVERRISSVTRVETTPNWDRAALIDVGSRLLALALFATTIALSVWLFFFQ